MEAFAEVPDLRKARGIRHGVLAIRLLGACAVLTGARSFAAIAEYAHDGTAARERGRGHGRVKTRSICVLSLQSCPDLGGEFFPRAAQAIEVFAAALRRHARDPHRPLATYKIT